MKLFYKLRINITTSDQAEAVSRILGKQPSRIGTNAWELETTDAEVDANAADFVSYFSSILKGRFTELKAIGVEDGDVSIWVLYAFDQQCNLEFSQQQIRLVADMKAALCVSCWQASDGNE